MNLGQMAGLTGLAKNTDRVAESQRNLATLKDLDNGIQKDKQESMMLQELEAKQYEEINKKAEELLEPDRLRIQSKSLELQANIRSKIKEYGSRKMFFESGGVALLSKYKSELLTSPETLAAKDNKDNMVQILAAQAAGKSGLLSAVDMKNLTDYQNGLGTKVTYSGLKSEVEIPADAFDYGENIPAIKILHNKDNYMRIYGNYLKDHPEMKGLKGDSLETELLEYTYQNHGQSQGLNQFRMQQEEAERRYQRERANAVADTRSSKGSGKEEEPDVSFVTMTNNILKAADNDLVMTLDNVSGVDQKGHAVNYFQNLKKVNQGADILLGGKNKYYSEAFKSPPPIGKWSGLDNIAYDVKSIFNANEKFQPASAITFANGNQKLLNAKFFTLNTDGTVNVPVNKNDFLDPKGEKLNEEYLEDYGEKPRQMNVQSYIIGFQDENGKLVTNVLDNNDKPLTDKQALDKHKAIYSGRLSHELFAVLKDVSTGKTLYKKVGMNSIEDDTNLSLALGKANNIGKTLKDTQDFSNLRSNVNQDKKLKTQIVNDEFSKASTSKGAFGKEAFIAEARQMTVAGQGDRTSLLKAFYAAYDDMNNNGNMSANGMNSNGLIDSRKFTEKINAFPQLKQATVNRKYSDSYFIKLFTETFNKDDPDHQEENNLFASKWKEYYNVINKNK